MMYIGRRDDSRKVFIRIWKTIQRLSQVHFSLPGTLELDEVDFRKVGRAPTENSSAFSIQSLVLVTDPNVFAKALSAEDLVVTHPYIVSRYPNNWSSRSESIVLERTLNQLVTLIRGEIFKFIVDSRKQSISHSPSMRALSLGVFSKSLA